MPFKGFVAIAMLCVLVGCGGGQPAPTSAQLPMSVATSAVSFPKGKLSYAITRTASGYTVTDKSTGAVTSVAAGTPQIRFTDSAVLFDASGVEGQAYRLYQAAFNRAPDMGGLGFQIDAVGQLSLTAVAGNFLASPEFQERYSNSLTDTQFVMQLYQNVLHRAPDASGLAFHLANLAAGLPRSYLLVQFSESPENKNNVVAAIESGVTYFPAGVSGFTGPDEPIEADPSTANIGVTTKIGANGSYATAMALQPDGKIVVAGVAVTSTRDNDFAVARYNPNGSVDTSFGGTGTITINISGRVASTDWARGVVVQADGKIVVVGYTQASGSLSSGVAIVRLKADGTLDPTFGVSGVLTSVDSVKNKMAHAVALQRDGKIVIAGSVNCISRYVAGYCTLVERYNTDGSRDGTFSGPGVDLVDDATLGAQGLVLQGDGKIVVVGTQNRGNGNELSVARYGANGSIDATFGQSGVSMVPIGMDVGSSNTGTSIALQADGKIVVAGEAHTDAANNHFSVTRLLSSGAVDTGFGNAGSVVTNVAVPPESDYPWVVSVQPDGKILLAGERTIARTNPWPLPGVYRAANVDFAAVRYTAAGTLDALFGVGGIVTTDVRSFEDRVHAMAVQADGSIVFAGESFINDSSNTSGGYTSFSLVRVKSNGSLDAGFGSGH